MTLTLELRAGGKLPIDLGSVTPTALAPMSAAAAERHPIRVGNASAPLGEVFHVAGDATDLHLVVRGDLDHVAALGADLEAGRIDVEGNVGPRCGARMRGGVIDVRGDVGDWAGAALRGGLLRVRGSAGDCLAASLPGSSRGMTGGEVLVDGDVGDSCGVRMRRGLVAVGGAVGALAGAHMLAGTLYVGGACGPHPGVGMRRGTLGLWGSEPPALPNAFRYACTAELPMLPLLAARLRTLGAAWEPPSGGPAHVHLGDFLALGRGEILTRVR